MNDRIEAVFRAADGNLHCNTAYPIFKNEFRSYEAAGDIMEGTEELSFYIHIPFCRHLCSFCEYTRFLAGNKAKEDLYLTLLERQIRDFLRQHRIRKVYGLDIGGGTPSALDDENFEKVLILADSLLAAPAGKGGRTPEPAADFERSIEISFTTITQAKIRLIGKYGIKRVSAGIQSMSRSLLMKHDREYNELREISGFMKALHEAGVEKINLDLMYGMPGMTDDLLQGTLDAIQVLNPEQVTVYEMRYNRMKQIPAEINRELLFRQYRLLYERLIQMGYRGRFGKNAFTRGDDHGVSSYIWHRMDQGIPYKGFGISAQSMSRKGISYGRYKNTELAELPEADSFESPSAYFLPTEELAAKYVSVAMYNGSFRLDVLSGILGRDSREVFNPELDYLLEKGYVTIRPCEVDGIDRIDRKKEIDRIGDDKAVCPPEEVILTEKGFRYYGAAAALFWSELQKDLLLRQAEERNAE